MKAVSEKIALISDIHANGPALKAVMDDIRQRDISTIWHLGDLIGYGAYPNKVVRMLESENVFSIAGNYDRKVLDFLGWKDKRKNKMNPSKYFNFEWTFNRLKEKSKSYIHGLSHEAVKKAGGVDFLLVHGSPESIDEPLTEDTPMRRYRQLAQLTDASVILFGHTHVFFSKTVGKKIFVNPGSVGRPFDGDNRASYVILKVKEGSVEVKNIRLSYNIEKSLAKMKKENFPQDVIDSIAQATSL